jgi:hypothetical protein
LTNYGVLTTGAIQTTGTFNLTISGGITNTLARTNVIGFTHLTAAAVLVLSPLAANDWSVTNRIAAATSLVFTNTSDGDELYVSMLGETSGGTSRVVTLVPQLGHLVANLDTYGTVLATSGSFTLTNGNAADISWKVSKMNGTNVAKFITRQYSF